jgi:hypothetical protein
LILSFILFFNLFRFEGFNDLNKEDQTELKKKFGSSTVTRKRKGDKVLSVSNQNDDAPKAKQSKTEENNELTSEQDEARQKKVSFSFLLKLNFRSFFMFRNKVNYFGNIKML